MTRKEVIQRLEDIKYSATIAKKAVKAIEIFEMIADDIESDEKAIDIAIETIKNQKIGYWIENAPEWQNIDPPYICSECGNFHLKKTNYCDQCGAKMIEQQKSEDNNETD